MKALKALLTGIFKSRYHKVSPKQEAKKEGEPVFITLAKAKRDHALVKKIYTQLNSAKLTLGSGNNYMAGVTYKNHQYYILGAQEEWDSFFSMKQ